MVGQTLQHYQVVEKLGEGGMGVVYKARDVRLNRFVVLKVLRPDAIGDEDRRRRFFQEALAASALNHPNIITIYDISSAAGVAFIVMEYVSGVSLDAAIPAGGMPVSEALKYGFQIADALAVAHAAGVIHRDLKPANIMITPAGLLKLLDFGLAKLTDAWQASAQAGMEFARTMQGSVIGTLSYMSPEQAMGRPLDARTDIFSLGVVLYEMITGRRAFGGGKMPAISGVLREIPPVPSTIKAGVPPAVDRLIMRCLEKDPAQRYGSAAEVRAEIDLLRLPSNPPAAAPVPVIVVAGECARGREALHRWTAASLAQAKECFESVLRAGTDRCSAYACISEYYTDAALLGLRAPEDAFPKGEWAARKALETDPACDGAHVSIGIVESWSRRKWLDARDHLARASSAESRQRRALWYLRPLGLFAEAEAGLWGNPLGLTWLYLEKGDLRAAAQQGAAAGDHWIAAWAMAWSMLERGMSAQAIDVARRALAAEPSQSYLESVLAVGLALAGQVDAARAMLVRDRWVPPSWCIPLHAVFGDVDAVFSTAAEAVRKGDPCLLTNLRMPPCVELQSDPRYTAVIRDLGIPDVLKRSAG